MRGLMEVLWACFLYAVCLSPFMAAALHPTKIIPPEKVLVHYPDEKTTCYTYKGKINCKTNERKK